jgi:hypothetical protein
MPPRLPHTMHSDRSQPGGQPPTASSELLEQRSTALPDDRASRQSGGNSPGPLLRGLYAVRIQVKLGVSGEWLSPLPHR